MDNIENNMITPDFAGAAKILRGYKNKYEGKRCFIIGNGSSLKAEDLDKIHENGDFSIASNRIYLIFKDTEWRPDIYTTVDVNAIKVLQEEISAIKAELKIIPVIPSDKIPIIDGALTIPLSTNKIDYTWILHNALPPFSNDITHIVYNGKTITYMNLQLAVYLGFKEIILLGIDHFYPKMGFIPELSHIKLRPGEVLTINTEIRTFKTEDGNTSGHFCENYYEGLDDKDGEASYLNEGYLVEAATLAYQAAKKYAMEHGIKIVNATRGGRLNVFKRVNFDSLFPKK